MHSKWIIALVVLGALLYLVSPPRSYWVYIEAEPVGDQRFYLVTKSGRGSFHGRDVNHVDKRFVLPNQKQRITLDSDQTQWFGSLSVNLFHPEYFYEIVSVEGWLFGRSVTMKPTAWSTALSNSPSWLLEYPQMKDRSEAFIAARQAHRVILLSDVHYQLVALSTHYLDLYMSGGVTEPLRRSIDAASRIVPLLESGLYGEFAFGVRNVEFHKQKLSEIHKALEDVRRRTATGD